MDSSIEIQDMIQKIIENNTISTSGNTIIINKRKNKNHTNPDTIPNTNPDTNPDTIPDPEIIAPEMPNKNTGKSAHQIAKKLAKKAAREMKKKSKNIMLVDTSFWLYYRFFALRKWFHQAYPEKMAVNPEFNTDYDWLEDQQFMAKYKKLFIGNIKTYCKKYKIPIENVIFCIDCPHDDIWRLEHYTEYKGTRMESHRKNEFNSWDIFKHIKTDYLPELQSEYNIKILSCPECEADDIIGNSALELINQGIAENVYILSNDNDYMQISSPVIHILDGRGMIKNNPGDNLAYLIKKILIGDVSDNIKPCQIDTGYLENEICSGTYKQITKQNINSILADQTKYNYLCDLLNQTRNGTENNVGDGNSVGDGNIAGDGNNVEDKIIIKNFNKNCRLMDFQMLPDTLKQNINLKIKELFNTVN